LHAVVQRRYMDNVPAIVPLLEREHRVAESRLATSKKELDDLATDKLKVRRSSPRTCVFTWALNAGRACTCAEAVAQGLDVRLRGLWTNSCISFSGSAGCSGTVQLLQELCAHSFHLNLPSNCCAPTICVLQDKGRVFREAFLNKLSLLLRGTVAAPADRFGETLADEHMMGGEQDSVTLIAEW
jgi:hypothetical protein